MIKMICNNCQRETSDFDEFRAPELRFCNECLIQLDTTFDINNHLAELSKLRCKITKINLKEFKIVIP